MNRFDTCKLTRPKILVIPPGQPADPIGTITSFNQVTYSTYCPQRGEWRNFRAHYAAFIDSLVCADTCEMQWQAHVFMHDNNGFVPSGFKENS